MSGLSDRLRIMHHWLYPEALRRVSAVLDTFPYGGCLTVLEVNVVLTYTFPQIRLSETPCKTHPGNSRASVVHYADIISYRRSVSAVERRRLVVHD